LASGRHAGSRSQRQAGQARAGEDRCRRTPEGLISQSDSCNVCSSRALSSGVSRAPPNLAPPEPGGVEPEPAAPPPPLVLLADMSCCRVPDTRVPDCCCGCCQKASEGGAAPDAPVLVDGSASSCCSMADRTADREGAGAGRGHEYRQLEMQAASAAVVGSS
jgi:hypothetical protein